MVLPALAFFTFFGAVPLVGVVILSMTDWPGFGALRGAGLSNWSSILQSSVMWHSLMLTFLVMGLTIVIQTPLALLLGVFTAGHQRYRAFLAVVYFLPLLLSAAAISAAY